MPPIAPPVATHVPVPAGHAAAAPSLPSFPHARSCVPWHVPAAPASQIGSPQTTFSGSSGFGMHKSAAAAGFALQLVIAAAHLPSAPQVCEPSRSGLQRICPGAQSLVQEACAPPGQATEFGVHVVGAVQPVAAHLYPAGVSTHVLVNFVWSAAVLVLLPHTAPHPRFGAGVHSAALQAAVSIGAFAVDTHSWPAAHAVGVYVLPSAHVATLPSGRHFELPTTHAPMQSPSPVHDVAAGHVICS